MDPTSAAGIGVLVFKLALFALLVQAARRAGRAAEEVRRRRAADDAPAPPAGR